MSKTILVIGAFDTKGSEYKFICGHIKQHGHSVLTINTGVLGTTDLFKVDVEADEVAKAGYGSIEKLRASRDRGQAMKVMCTGAAATVKKLFDEGKFDGIIGMGGTGGTTVVTCGMRVLPVGFPKVCISTAASGETSAYVGTKDITMIPSVVDVAGLNRISNMIFTRAASAICGMVEAEPSKSLMKSPSSPHQCSATLLNVWTDAEKYSLKKITRSWSFTLQEPAVKLWKASLPKDLSMRSFPYHGWAFITDLYWP